MTVTEVIKIFPNSREYIMFGVSATLKQFNDSKKECVLGLALNQKTVSVSCNQYGDIDCVVSDCDKKQVVDGYAN